ncbi:MAG: hypothetical protein LBL30_01840 [Holosporales bacterium]|jgi:hypothetical protein|nr:hypothetical protein [Holosporales bacterium]
MNKKQLVLLTFFLLSGLSSQAAMPAPLGFSQEACWSQFVIWPEEKPRFVVALSEVDRSTLPVVRVGLATDDAQAEPAQGGPVVNICILGVDKNPNFEHPTFRLDLRGCSQDFFLQVVARPYLLGMRMDMSGRKMSFIQRPFLIAEPDPDRLLSDWDFVTTALAGPCDDIKAKINGVYGVLQVVESMEQLSPPAAIASFQDRLPRFIDSLARKLHLLDSEKDFFSKIIGQGEVFIAPYDSQEMVDFRKAHDFKDDLIVGYYSHSDKKNKSCYAKCSLCYFGCFP